MGPEEAIAYADELRNVLGFNTAFVLFTFKHSTSTPNATLYDLMIKVPDTRWEFSAGTAFDKLEQLVNWCHKTGTANCSVTLESS